MILVKQFGEKRTATSYLSVLLKRNFKDLVVGNLLGWKHGIPESLRLWIKYLKDPNRAVPMSPDIANKSIAMVETTMQWAHMQAKKRMATKMPKLVRHYRRILKHIPNLAYTVSIKHPYAWIRSVIKFEAAWGAGREENMLLHKKLCERFNYHYQAWWDFMHRKNAAPCSIVRHEDILSNWLGVLERLEQELGLTRRRKELFNITKVVNPDASLGAEYDKRTKNTAYYLEHHYMQEFTKKALAVVRKHINWDLMKLYSYQDLT